ncbi:HEPN domain-containing protein [Candidatus Marithioploca araucensis]|uniref:HEPN domain-containing protein n=1 Tax=Candidatus Marithioploca araucensis TaxID=70273 RepID=A0ABT7VTC8_9GAMM|nr:HEPN domain-containing protein [Candidatus Marithioploca araucensis]
MATKTELRILAKARLKEAQILFEAKRYDAATYLCGYAMELALKARIGQTLGYIHFPQSNKEFLQMTCKIAEKSLKSKRFQKLYRINPNDFCALYEKYFQNPRFLKVHDLLTLLKFSGVIEKIKNHFSIEWSIVEKWNPEIRYKPVGSYTRQTTQDMLTSTQVLMTALK